MITTYDNHSGKVMSHIVCWYDYLYGIPIMLILWVIFILSFPIILLEKIYQK